MSTENKYEKKLEDNIFYIKLLQELNKENPNVELLKYLDSKIQIEIEKIEYENRKY